MRWSPPLVIVEVEPIGASLLVLASRKSTLKRQVARRANASRSSRESRLGVRRMHVFDVNAQPFIEARGVEVHLLVLANRCGVDESLLKFVGVFLHRTAMLTNASEGVSPKTRSKAKMEHNQAHELTNRGALRLEELLATMEPARHILTPIAAWELQSGELRRLAKGVAGDLAAGASSGGGRLLFWLPESSVAGPFPASSCRSIYWISPCSVYIATIAAYRAWTDSAEA
nr:hypothetical protein Iba_chr14fCG8480 [Ipomoea batatas]